jgi:uncharacterized protein
MTSFFPDINVWIALSVAGHRHHSESWDWLNAAPPDIRLIFARYTQVGLLRLLTNQTIMGDQVLTVRKAWAVYDRWLDDPRVEAHPEPRGLDDGFRQTTALFSGKAASKWIGDCYLLAHARHSSAVSLRQACMNCSVDNW